MRVGLAAVLIAGLFGCPLQDKRPACCDAGQVDAGPGGGGGGADAGEADAGCLEQWQCAAWEVSDAGIAARVCTDANACGTNNQRPASGPSALPLLDLPYFKCEVQPVLERGCGMLGCHGTLTDRPFRLFARGRLRNSEPVDQVSTCPGPGSVDLAAEGTGTVWCVGSSRLTASEWTRNFEAARAVGIGVANVIDNELLTQPLQGSARVHAGVKPLALNDASYLKLKSWLSGSMAPESCDAGFN